MGKEPRPASVVGVDERGKKLPGTRDTASLRKKESNATQEPGARPSSRASQAVNPPLSDSGYSSQAPPTPSSDASSPEVGRVGIATTSASQAQAGNRGRLSRAGSTTKHRSASKATATKEKHISRGSDSDRPSARTSKSENSAYYGPHDIVTQGGTPPARPSSAAAIPSPSSRPERRPTAKYPPIASSARFQPMPPVVWAPPYPYFAATPPRSPYFPPQQALPIRQSAPRSLNQRFGPEQPMRIPPASYEAASPVHSFAQDDGRGIGYAPNVSRQAMAARRHTFYGGAPYITQAQQDRIDMPPPASRPRSILKQQQNHEPEIFDYDYDEGYAELPAAPAPPMSRRPSNRRKSVSYEANASRSRGTYLEQERTAQDHMDSAAAKAMPFSKQTLRIHERQGTSSSRDTRSTAETRPRSTTTKTTHSNGDEPLDIIVTGHAVVNHKGQQIQILGAHDQETQVRILGSGTVRGSQAPSVYHGDRRPVSRRGESVDFLAHTPKARKERESRRQYVPEPPCEPRRHRDDSITPTPGRRHSSARPTRRVTEYFDERDVDYERGATRGSMRYGR